MRGCMRGIRAVVVGVIQSRFRLWWVEHAERIHVEVVVIGCLARCSIVEEIVVHEPCDL